MYAALQIQWHSAAGSYPGPVHEHSRYTVIYDDSYEDIIKYRLFCRSFGAADRRSGQSLLRQAAGFSLRRVSTW